VSGTAGPVSTRPISVLLIDDEETWVRTQRRLFERSNETFRVSTATSFESARAVLAESCPDCIVSDYQLGDGTGVDLLAEVRAENPTVPFILVTGEGDEGVASEAIGERVTDYIPKLHLSREPARLANRIESAVAADRTRRALTRERRSKEALLEMVTSSTTRSDLGDNICDRLVEGGYACAWIAVLDDDGGVVPLSAAGETDYLEVAITPGTRPIDSTEPTLVALDGSEPVVRALAAADRTGTDPGDGAWLSTATDHGFRSVAAVPIGHNELQFGVLTVYSDAAGIDDRELRLLSAYADTVGYAFQTTAWKRRLLSSADASVEFTVGDDCHPLVALASRLPDGTTLRAAAVIPRNDREALYVTTVHGATDADVSDAGDATDAVVSIDLARTDDERGVRCGIVAESPVPETRLADVGAALSQTVVDGGQARISAALGGETTVKACIKTLSDHCGKRSVTTLWTAAERAVQPGVAATDELTDRQRQVLELAVEAGYFERPRHNNTGELADALDISRATFTQHLRAAQRKLFESFGSHRPRR